MPIKGIISSLKDIEVRYSETDQMGRVYHTNYFIWLEIGRTDLFAKLGIHYSYIEKKGFFIPVVELYARYKAPANYGDIITVESALSEYGDTLFKIKYRVKKNSTLLLTGYSSHCFLDASGKLIKIPMFFIEAVEKNRGNFLN